MALSFVAGSPWVSTTTSVTPTLPTGTVVGDLVLIALVSKYDDAALGGAPAGWTDLGTATNTGRPTGADNGNLKGRLFSRIWQTGDTVLPTLDPIPNNVSSTCAATYRVAAGAEYSVAVHSGVDDTVGSPLAFTTTDTMGLTVGDFLQVFQAVNGDTPTWGLNSFTATGVTFGAGTAIDASTIGGTDMRMRQRRAQVTAGTATGNVTVSTVLAGTVTNAVGVGFIVRIREVAAAPTTSKVQLGDTLVSAMNLGDVAVAAAYLGDVKVLG